MTKEKCELCDGNGVIDATTTEGEDVTIVCPICCGDKYVESKLQPKD